VVFDNTSFPQVTQLAGTVFALAAPADPKPPVTVATQHPRANAAGWNNTDVVVTLKATDDGSGVAHTEFKLNDGDWRPYAAPIVIAAEGVHKLRYRSRDAANNVEAAEARTIRIDRTAPSISAAATPAVLWPPNHKLIDVSIKVRLKDALSGDAGFTLVSIKSSERDDGRGDGHTTSDMRGWAVGTADTRGQLRAERSHGGRGRTYTLTYQGTDVAGNVATTTVTVKVPDDRKP
jgi:hypothetical protein